MEKSITYNGTEYKIDIRWTGSNYAVAATHLRRYVAIPNECISDIDKIKPYIIEAIENNHELKHIERWDGKI